MKVRLLDADFDKDIVQKKEFLMMIYHFNLNTAFGYANFYAVYGLFLLGLVGVAMVVVRETQA